MGIGRGKRVHGDKCIAYRKLLSLCNFAKKEIRFTLKKKALAGYISPNPK
jgi:hypothetical protein